jgi:predicted nucleic acid-binding protein
LQRSPDGFVVDSSVAVKWYLADEPLADNAAAVWKHYEEGRIAALAPHLSRYEVASALTVATWTNRVSAENAGRQLGNFLRSRVALDRDPDWLLLEAHELSIELRIASYDAIYIALGNRLGLPVLTADDKLYRAARDKAPLLTWLGEFR